MKRLFLFALSTAFIVMLATGCHSNEGKSAGTTPVGLDANEPGMQDAIFVRDALIGGLDEIEMGRLAMQRVENLDLKLLAQRIFDDHTRANKDLKIIARQEGVPLPELPTPAMSAEHFESMSGTDFDEMYLRYLLETHREDIKKFAVATRDARNLEIRNFAARVLPALQEHLRIAENIGKMSGLSRVIREPAGAEIPRLKGDPYYEGDPTQRHQFDNELSRPQKTSATPQE